MRAVISGDGAAQRVPKHVDPGRNFVQSDRHHKFVHFIGKASQTEIITLANLGYREGDGSRQRSQERGREKFYP